MPRHIPDLPQTSANRWNLSILTALTLALTLPALRANDRVHITRFWHNHQPIYWPEWNSGTGQDSRVQYAHDSMRLKPTQNYGAPWNHPHNDLEQIFGLNDRIASYQFRPRNALTQIDNSAGFALSYSGSLIDNIRNLAANSWNYGSNWNAGNTEARSWTTPAGSPRLDLVGFSYHHSLNPLLPKEVMRKELRIFKEAWWKAWGGNPDKSDHSRGFFPTEMAYSRDLIDVLVDEGYTWVIVASHHLSRTSPSYNDRVTPASFQIKSSPPNRADQLAPRFDNPDQWWFAEPNPGQAAWNVAPYAYQLHRVQYVNPDTGAIKEMIAVPSDDVLSYQAGYSGAQIGIVDSEIAPWATDPLRPLLIMPATDGDNAWGGGFDSWEVATPGFFGAAQSRGYRVTTPQDFVNQFGPHAPVSHIEEGAWIYPEMCYGSPYFLKWIEPPVITTPDSPTRYPGTIIDVENGWSLKFFAYAPKMAGANWVITAEQIHRGLGGSVQDWKIQAPYDWDGSWTAPNEVERAWHIYLKGLDSGFQYYGGLGNDDEVKPGLATRRAQETLQSWLADKRHLDQTGPTVLKPQRFPYNPGGHTFGWFNSIPGGDTAYLKSMPSEFYVWSLIHDLNGVQSADLMIRRDLDGTRSLANTHNETYAGGPDVGPWIRIPMTRRVLPNTRAELNALANNGQIDFVVTALEIADHYHARIDESVLPGFRDNLFDYYIESTDTLGNLTRTDIQHVYVEDDGTVTTPPPPPQSLAATPQSASRIQLTWDPAPLASAYRIYRDGSEIATTSRTEHLDTGLVGGTLYTYTLRALNAAGLSDLSDPVTATTPEAPDAPPAPAAPAAEVLSHSAIRLTWSPVPGAFLYRIQRDGFPAAETADTAWTDSSLQPETLYTYTLTAENEGGVSPPSTPVTATTAATPPAFDLGEPADPAGYLLYPDGMRVFAAVRGTLLYVATWAPSPANGNDHLLLITDELLPAPATPAPWGKNGLTAHPPGKPFLAAESENNYTAWFNTNGHGTFTRTETRLEGVIDLIDVFGTLPETLHIAALAYQTGDNGLLGSQGPAGNSDPNLDPAEFFTLPLAALRDTASNGILDRLDPARAFRTTLAPGPLGAPALHWPAVPGRTYTLLRAAALTGEHAGWTVLDTWTAPSGTDQASLPLPLPLPESTPAAFYTLEVNTSP